MIDPSTLLDIQLFDGTDYIDLTMALGASGNAPQVSFTVDSYLYIGYQKPIKSVFFDFKTPNLVANTLTVEHSSPSGWEVVSVYDETKGFTKAGFIQWLELSGSSIAEATVNSVTKNWIRIKPSVDHTPATIWNFIGLILSNDHDLQLENPYILDSNLMMGQPSHLNAHIAARNEIVQSLSNKGVIKLSGTPKRLTFWDILDIQEFKQGAMFLALSKIYFNLSDNRDDTWLAKSREYRKFYLEQIDLYYRSIDLNNDGLSGAGETSAISRSKTLYR